jgi:hypothetical protein
MHQACKSATVFKSGDAIYIYILVFKIQARSEICMIYIIYANN